MLSQFFPPIPKWIYNEDLDERLFKMLGIDPGDKISAAEFLEKILSHMPEIIPLATHPGEDESYTKNGLLNAMKL
jgi:hypothetical protein